MLGDVGEDEIGGDRRDLNKRAPAISRRYRLANNIDPRWSLAQFFGATQHVQILPRDTSTICCETVVVPRIESSSDQACVLGLTSSLPLEFSAVGFHDNFCVCNISAVMKCNPLFLIIRAGWCWRSPFAVRFSPPINFMGRPPPTIICRSHPLISIILESPRKQSGRGAMFDPASDVSKTRNAVLDTVSIAWWRILLPVVLERTCRARNAERMTRCAMRVRQRQSPDV
jgi:hypothetical protein